jgi:hypothetical protein
MDPNIWPLHEAPSVPVLKMFGQSKVHVPPRIPNLMPANDHSLPPYMAIAPVPTAPPPPKFPSTLISPPANTFESSNSMGKSLMEQQAMMSPQHSLVTSPTSEYSNFLDPFQIFSMTAPSSTSFPHEEPIAAVNTDVIMNGHFDPGLIFQHTPWPIPEVGSVAQRPPFPLESQYCSLRYKIREKCQILGSPSYIDPYGPSFGGYPIYPYAQWQMPTDAPNVTPHSTVIDAMNRAISSKRVKREYTCLICDATFPTPQAFGGHMSSHSKAARKQNVSSDPTSHPRNVSGASKVDQDSQDVNLSASNSS